MNSFLLALVVAGAAPTLAQEATAPQAPAAELKRICRREPVTGSIMPGGEKVCLTKDEWARVARARQDAVDRDVGARRPSGGLTGTN